MKLLAIALIAAVAVNCFVKTANGKPAADTSAVPNTDALLPPLVDTQPDSKNAFTKNIAAATTTTTRRPITSNESNVLPELSTEALLPPLLETEIENAATEATTSVKAAKLKVPDLLLDALVPPLSESNKADVQVSTATSGSTRKPTTKPYYQPQKHHSKDYDNVHNKRNEALNVKHLQASTTNTASNDAKIHRKLTDATNNGHDKHVAESQIHPKQVSLDYPQSNVKTDKITEQQHAANHGIPASSHNGKAHNNYSLDLFLGPTTAKPRKSGLPTITPFPHRLGR